jgi:NADPH-dependent 2,4-dienoyl-CoA reductase/sulfur reductase-like enzyme
MITRMAADVLVVGAGAAGVTAALAARELGADVILLERAPAVGGELIGGLPYLGTHNAIGERIVGGAFDRLLDECRRLGGFVEVGFDGRLMWGTMADPETMKLAVVSVLARSGVRVLPGCFVHDVVGHERRVDGVVAATKSGPIQFSSPVVVEASGDADVVVGAGGPFWKGDENGVLQPVWPKERTTSTYTDQEPFRSGSPWRTAAHTTSPLGRSFL